MNKKSTARCPHHQKKYRQSQRQKGLVRFELQVSAKAKARFDALVAEAAQEYPEPWDPRRRQAKARAQVFEEITQGIQHEFFTLKDQIRALQAEVNALAPAFFKTSTNGSTPHLPEAIRALPDDPHALKIGLAHAHQAAQHAKREALKYQHLAQQFEALYDAASRYNDQLRAELERKESSV